jgi:uncharacterized protein YjbI with pentapeptide repeats
MNLTEKILAVLTETVKSPFKTSYVFQTGSRKVVLRRGGDYSGLDLSGLDLSGLDLRDITLKDVNLEHTNLARANLAGAHLENATLLDTNLTGAMLSGAFLDGAEIDFDTLRRALDADEISIDDIDLYKPGG